MEMEKRVLISIVLSVFILYLWGAVFPSPEKNSIVNNSQIVENKDFIKKDTGGDVVSEKTVTKSTEPEQTIIISNSKIQAEFSSRNGAIKQVKLVGYDADLPVTKMNIFTSFNGLDYRVVKQSDKEIQFEAKNDGIIVRKFYELPDDEFVIKTRTEMENTTTRSIDIDPDMIAMVLDMNFAGEDVKNGRDRNLFEYSAFVDGKVIRKTGAFKFSSKDAKVVYQPAQWLGFRNRYFAAIFNPQFNVNGYQFKPINDNNKLQMSFLADTMAIAPGESATFPVVIYAGPQKDDILAAYNANFEKIHVYFRMGFFDAIAKIIEDLMKLFHRVIPNWGVSIIIVSLLIYFLMYPFTMKSMISMRKMQSLQPKIAELREKHEKNPQKLNQEIMKLYAENKINPLGGCLPLLLQMPVFIALYQMIWRSVIFKGANFLWIKDLSMPDRLFVLDRSFPVIGNEINILPMIILILMIIQQRMTSKNMISADPNQIAQQKMMMFVMPAVLLLVFYHLGSGLTLYLTVFYLMSLFTQWRSSKIIKST